MNVKRTSVVLALLFLVIVAMPVAASALEISPFYVNVSRASCTLSFSGDKAICNGNIMGLSGTTDISATMTLQRKNSNGTYTDVKSWTASSKSSTLDISKDWYVSTGYSYRVTLKASVTRNGTTENVSVSGGDVKCG